VTTTTSPAAVLVSNTTFSEATTAEGTGYILPVADRSSPHGMHGMRSVATDDSVAWRVCISVSVCQFVCLSHARALWKGGTLQGSDWGTLLGRSSSISTASVRESGRTFCTCIKYACSNWLARWRHIPYSHRWLIPKSRVRFRMKRSSHTPCPVSETNASNKLDQQNLSLCTRCGNDDAIVSDPCLFVSDPCLFVSDR